MARARPFVAIVVVFAFALAFLACSKGGGGSPGTPVAAAERALTLASQKDELGFAKMLASGPRGKSSAKVQLERLSYWLWLRWAGALDLISADLEGWDAPRGVTETPTNATVATVLRFKSSLFDPPERPVPLEIDLVVEGGAWRIAEARVKPTPTWFLGDYDQQVEQARVLGEPPPDPPKAPTLAEIADSYRPPPPNQER